MFLTIGQLESALDNADNEVIWLVADQVGYGRKKALLIVASIDGTKPTVWRAIVNGQTREFPLTELEKVTEFYNAKPKEAYAS